MWMLVQKINSGLLVLGKVFTSIQQRQRPPFRESKLTYLLQVSTGREIEGRARLAAFSRGAHELAVPVFGV